MHVASLLYFHFRFRRAISISELYQMRDVIDIVERDGHLVAMMTDDSVSPSSTSLTDDVSLCTANARFFHGSNRAT